MHGSVRVADARAGNVGDVEQAAELWNASESIQSNMLKSWTSSVTRTSG